ncbi:MAG: SusC/RagA family TonB-linked outer membrane protein [Bacteroidales bacterium]|nr:SusC/RagA family TonB-linked outer membrane protein [Bacteroidales bacterium]
MQITGKVTSATDGLPIPGVSIVVQSMETIGTATSLNGEYSITVPTGAQNLEFSAVGMTQAIIPINGQSVIDVVMEEDILEMDEVIVVAYGTSKKESFTGSAKMIGKDVLERRIVSSATKALEGVVAGVQTTSGGGQPGAGLNIRIRGFGSINASNNPLYVVDGMPYDGNINSINPSDIQSISVLKDASASALYGARGANGVVIITTKKGTKGEPEINFKATFGSSSPSVENYSTVDENSYMELFFESYKNSFMVNNGLNEADATNLALNGDATTQSYMERLGGEVYNPFNVSSELLIDPATGKVVDNASLKYHDSWFDEILREDNLRQEYQLSISGGDEKTQYLISLGYLDDKGIVVNSQFNRYSARLNLDSKVKEWLKVGMNTNYSATEKNYLTNTGSSYNNVWFSTLAIAPIYPVYERNTDGSVVYDSEGNKVFDAGVTRPYANNFNSIATLHDDSYALNFDNLSSRFFFDLDTDKDIPVIKDIKFTVNLGFDYNGGNRLEYSNPFHGDGSAVHGAGYKTNFRTLSYTLNQLLNYNKSFGEHSIDLLGGHEYYDYQYSRFYASKQNYLFEGLTELDGAATTTGASSYTHAYRIESYLSRLNYDYSNKYYLSFSWRTDGSSRFHKDYRWGQFWSAGASWRASEESFMQNLDWLTNMTLKASYGSQGNDDILHRNDGSQNFTDSPSNYYIWQSFYSSEYPNASNGGVWLESLENKEVEWEKNKNFNIGLESYLFDRISFSAEYFQKTTSDLLLFRPLATSTGFNGYWDNVGEMVNKGMDFDLSAQILKGDFRWTFGTQLSYVRNEVTELVTEGQELVNGSFIIKVGEPINSFYLPTSAGVDPATGAQLYLIKEEVDDGNGNMIIQERITDDYNEAAANKEIQGSRIPDFYGSINNTLSYKGFDLSVLLTYSIGGYVLDGVYSSLFSTRNAGDNFHTDAERRWQEPGDVTDVPRLVHGQINYTTNDRLIDASYLSIKNISLGYTLPKNITEKAKIKSCRIFVTADNLALFTKLKGMDPQYNFAGNQDYEYVPLKTLSAGIDIKF